MGCKFNALTPPSPPPPHKFFKYPKQLSATFSHLLVERVKARLTFLPKKTTELPGHALSQDPYNQSTQPQHFFQELNKCLLV